MGNSPAPRSILGINRVWSSMFPRRIRRHRSGRRCSNPVDVCPPLLAENCPKISWRAIMGGVAMETRMTPTKTISRRSFLTKAATTAAAVTIVPRYVLGRGFVPPSDTLNIAGVGVGGMGRANLINLSSQNIVALCDVDWGYAGKSLDRLDTEIPALQKRLDEPAPTTPQQSPAQPGQPPPQPFDRDKAKVRLDRMIRLKNDLLPK